MTQRECVSTVAVGAAVIMMIAPSVTLLPNIFHIIQMFLLIPPSATRYFGAAESAASALRGVLLFIAGLVLFMNRTRFVDWLLKKMNTIQDAEQESGHVRK